MLCAASLFVAIVSPVIGAIADRMPIKKKILWAYTIVGVIFTGMMGVAPHLGSGSDYKFLAFCLVIGNIGFSGGNVIYYAFMPYLAEINMWNQRCSGRVQMALKHVSHV